ncbi:hypothetical protein PC116_g18184 [Phytophthora cactorum]|nr:hypothetical protein Pcac1_g10826 [Phytophthora cactorum]KAG3154452.1 hypothetical protein C6341_g15653 [Phytophthora cactorum]KAG4233619.1 hypothetical protein PC116_g18184 [Phytophthora cactorum]
MYPLTHESKRKIAIVDRGLYIFTTPDSRSSLTEHQRDHKLGFFDDGPREDPGSGGIGSAIVMINVEKRLVKLEWAVVTALTNRNTTNNEEECVGLHRLLSGKYQEERSHCGGQRNDRGAH